MADNNWWKQNEFGIPPDDWGDLVKLLSQGAADVVWYELSEENQERFEAICAALRFCDWGRYGYSEIEAKEKVKEVKWGN